jgi:uncharacterized protein (TIGR02145 family)
MRYSMLSVVLLPVMLYSQIYITMEGTVNGTPTPLDSMLVTNLTQGGDTSLYFPDNVIALGAVGIGESQRGSARALRAHPNPFAQNTELSVELDVAGTVQLKLQDATGALLASSALAVGSGVHRFVIQCGRPGVHVLTVIAHGSYRIIRLIATEGGEQPRILLAGRKDRDHVEPGRSLFGWTAGDELRYIGYATVDGTLLSDTISDVPVASQTVVFELQPAASDPSAHSCGTPGVHNPVVTYGTMTDQQGNVYKTVVIGAQEWMAENLRTSIYRNGQAITHVTVNSMWPNQTNGAWRYYGNDAQNDCPYGKLYNWYAVADSRNVCPSGWHVPSDAEFSALGAELGGPGTAGGRMKSTSVLWQSPNYAASNLVGWSALPGGATGGSFQDLGTFGYWWSSTASSTSTAWFRFLYNTLALLHREALIKTTGMSVRCVRD